MTKPLPLDNFYAEYATATGSESNALLPPDIDREVGHFNVFDLADTVDGYLKKTPMAFDRRAFYKISVVRGRSRVEYADKVFDVEGSAIWFAALRVPYRWLPDPSAQEGYFCVFTDGFLLPANRGLVLDEFPVFQPGGQPIWTLTDAEYAVVAAIFQKMAGEINSGYVHKYDLLRAYLLELIHLGQKLQPAPAPAPTPNASARVMTRFTDLLDRQFPPETPQQPIRLRSAKAYADHLAVHVNHLNRVLKETTGHTTTELISGRLAQEARILLKQTDWTISEIADSLGFADVAHFCNFFKRQTGLIPGALRG